MISYSQQTGSGQATILNLILTEREKLRVWFDQYYAGQLSEQAMMQGVTSSNCLLLFVSAGVMKREFCIGEVRKAVALGKPILLVHEEDPRFNKDPRTRTSSGRFTICAMKPRRICGICSKKWSPRRSEGGSLSRTAW